MNDNIHTLIPLFVAVPLAGAILIQLAARWKMLLLMLMCIASIGHTGLYHMGGWPTPLGIDLRLDALATLLLLAINVVGLAVTLYSVEYMRRFTARGHYYGLFLLMVAGMNGVILAGDLFNLYVFLEVAAVASYALVAFGCAHEELEASFKYIVIGTLSSALILIGVALAYGVTGTLNMTQMSARIAETGLDAPMLLAFGLFICGFAFKAAMVPFHAWLPDAHPSAPAPVSAMLSGVLIKALGVYVLARLIFNVFGVGENELGLLRWLGLLSMTAGGLLAAGQKDIKRMFAYSSISQVGFIMVGLGLGTSLLFLNAGAIEYVTGTRNLKKLGGLNAAMPVTSATSMVGSMSIAGVPPFNGFWSKLIIILACVESGHYGFAAMAVVVSVITLAYQLKFQRMAFFDVLPKRLQEMQREPRLMALAMVLLAAGCIALSFAVVSGLRDPMLIGAAQQSLSAGIFGQ
jgi:multicomponent Na+:H+ antiporter subunit D